MAHEQMAHENIKYVLTGDFSPGARAFSWRNFVGEPRGHPSALKHDAAVSRPPERKQLKQDEVSQIVAAILEIVPPSHTLI